MHANNPFPFVIYLNLDTFNYFLPIANEDLIIAYIRTMFIDSFTLILR